MTEQRVVDDPALEPWRVDAADFPAGGTTSEVLAFAVRYAVLAPSPHNTQPWLFRVHEHVLDLLADLSRGLPVVDPDDRELTIGCGATLPNLRLALAHCGYRAAVELLPDPRDPELLARVRLDGETTIGAQDEELFRAIPLRHTSRVVFEERPVPADLVGRLVADAEAEGCRLAPVAAADVPELTRLVAEGDRLQMADRRFRRELASWMRGNRSGRRDGVRGYGVGFGELMSTAGPLVIRRFDVGAARAARDEELGRGAALVGVLCTERDERVDWLRAGQALQRVLLRACSHGVSASFLDQPVEVAELRPQLAALTGQDGHPQVVLRLGYGPEPVPEPRRPADEVTVADGERLSS